ncbi:MAG: ABC transporter permease [Anaerolineae bacterium]|nr:ABC transporter permease [Anaerolineae bacterium]
MSDHPLETQTTPPNLSVKDKGEQMYYATQWQLMWWQYKKNRMAFFGMFILGILYFMALFAGFLAPYESTERFGGLEMARPTQIHIRDEQGNFHRPFIYKFDFRVNMDTLRREFVENTSERFPIYFFVPGEPHKLMGVIPIKWRLLGTDGAPLLLFGADHLGRDLLSRTLYGSSISLFIGFVSVFMTFLIGVSLGGVAGYLGGVMDEVIMRSIDFMTSIPNIPLWMALASAIPRDWTVIQTYFAITVILSVISWGGLARVVRGKLLSLREEDFIMAARLYGATTSRLIFRYLVPNFTSYLLVNITLSIPQNILGETALSFLGLGIQPPAVSWGTLLQDAQNLTVVAQRPWQLIPGAFVVITVLMFNFVGDGLRDAADPYTRG